MKDCINWAIIAPGNIAGSMATAMNGVAKSNNPIAKKVRLYAVASRQIEKAKEFADKWNFEKAYGSYEELLNDPDVDAVYISNPHAFHFDSVMSALKANKNVLCEKPAGCSRNQLDEMINLAKEKNLFFMEAMWTAFNPCIAKIKECINSGIIGELKHIDSRFCNRIPYNPKDRLYAPELAGGALLDLGIYNIYFAMMINDFSPVAERSSIVRLLKGVDVWNSVNLSFKNGITTSFQSAADMSAASDTHDALIFGTKGYIKVENFFLAQKAEVHLLKSEFGNENEIVQKIDVPFMTNGYEYEFMHVTECILAGKKESPVHTWKKSQDLCEIMDNLRKDWNMKYPWEK